MNIVGNLLSNAYNYTLNCVCRPLFIRNCESIKMFYYFDSWDNLIVHKHGCK